MRSTNALEFQNALLALSDTCFAVTRKLIKDDELARRLTEETLLQAWAERETLDLSDGLKVVLLTRLRQAYVRRYRNAPAKATRDLSVLPPVAMTG